jgi:hypothetical protein
MPATLLSLIVGFLVLAPDIDTDRFQPYAYVSPKPGSVGNSRVSTIIIRPGPSIDPSSLTDRSVQVFGSVSGPADGEVHLSTDGLTILFKPAAPFRPGETVEVDVTGGIRTLAGDPVKSGRFEFTVSYLQSEPNPYDLLPELRPNHEAMSNLLRKVQSDSLPTGFPPLKTEMFDSTAVGEGYIFLAVASEVEDVGYYLMMLNNDGTPFFARELDHDYAYDFKMQPNGLLSYAHFFEHHSYTGGGNVVHKILDNSFTLVDSVQMGNGYVAEAHDFQILPNGHYLVFGYYLTPVDMSLIVEGGKPDALVSGGIVQELDAEKNVIFQWRSWDYHSFEEWEFNSRQQTRSIVSEFHLNTINLDDDGHIFLSTPRWTKKINRQTGDVMWTLGGHENEFSFVNVDSTEGIGLVGGHMFHRLDTGNILLYDNGNRQGTRSSRVNEFRMDEENRTMEMVWTYEPDSLVAGWHRGNAQRLPNGNTVIGWGGSSGNPSPAMTEVSPDGEKVYELTFVPPAIESYRAFRFQFEGGGPSATVIITEVAPGNRYDFEEGDSVSTGISIEIGSLGGTGYNELTVERYEYAPKEPRFPGRAPTVLPTRTILRQSGLSSLEADIVFDVDAWNIQDPANTIVYHREFEDQGLFGPLTTTFNPAKGELSASTSRVGEFILTTPDFESIVFSPLPLHPADGGTINQALTAHFEWTPVGYATTFDFQLSTDTAFADLVFEASEVREAVFRTDLLSDEMTYFWRVRATNDSGTSDWTATQSFSTVAPFITLDAPLGGEELVRGLDFYIRWQDNIAEDVVIELHLHDAVMDTIAITSSDGAFEWEVDVTLDPGPGYSVKIFSSVDASIVDSNAEPFSIVTTTDVESDIPEVVDRYGLLPPFPNPFNGSTRITVDLRVPGPLDLAVYDVQGRRLVSVADGWANAGRHEYRLDASSLAPGVYMIRMETAGTTQTRKVVLLD